MPKYATIPDAITPFEKIPDAKTKVCRLKNCFYLGAVQLFPLLSPTTLCQIPDVKIPDAKIPDAKISDAKIC